MNTSIKKEIQYKPFFGLSVIGGGGVGVVCGGGAGGVGGVGVTTLSFIFLRFWGGSSGGRGRGNGNSGGGNQKLRNPFFLRFLGGWWLGVVVIFVLLVHVFRFSVCSSVVRPLPKTKTRIPFTPSGGGGGGSSFFRVFRGLGGGVGGRRWWGGVGGTKLVQESPKPPQIV